MSERYDPYTKIRLVTEESDWPLVASLCTEDGTVVIDRGTHDRWHAAHDRQESITEGYRALGEGG